MSAQAWPARPPSRSTASTRRRSVPTRMGHLSTRSFRWRSRRLVAGRRGGGRALEQPVAGPIPPVRGTGENQAALEDRLAHERLACVVARVAVAIAAVQAEVVARHHDDVDTRHLFEDVVDEA